MRWYERFFRRTITERRLDSELRFHLDQQVADYVAAGMTPEGARRRARLEFGGVEQVKEQCRDVGASRVIETLIQDVRYGLRQLRRSPGFTAVAVVTLALGIGANTAIFSVVSAVLLRPLPFSAPGQLVRVVSMRLHGGVFDNASYPDFADWRTRNHVFAHLAAFNTDSFTLTGQGEAVHVQGAIVSADLFPLLGVKPILGRTFLPDEDKLSAISGGFPIILSHRLWRERFSHDPGIVGRSISLDNRSFLVVGVMPASFQFPVNAEPMDFWTIMVIEFVTAPGLPSMAEQRGAHYLEVIARLQPGVSISQAQAEMSTIVSALNKQYPENAPRGVRVMPELERLIGDVRPALLILLAAVGCVLLIACANVANLLLARGTRRQREMAIRGALGAARTRIIRQLLTESAMLATLGGALGAAVALWGIPLLIRWVPQNIPRLADVRLDTSVLLFTAFLSLLTGILFGLAPAIQASHSNFTDELKESARGLSGGRQRSRVRSILVIGDVAVAAVLLVGAGLLLQSFWRLQRIPLGFNPHHVLTFKIDLPYVHYSGARQGEFFQEAVTRLGRLPGVRSASAVLPLPLDGEDVGAGFDIEGEQVSEANQPRTAYSWAEPGYFHTVGIPLLQGRDFADTDDLKTTPVVIINQTLARRFFPGQNPLGRRIKPGIGNGYKAPPLREIVGVVGDVKEKGLTAESDPQVYVPLAQSPLGSMILVMHTNIDPAGMVGAARNVIAGLDKDLPISGVRTLDEYLDHTVAQPHFFSLLLGMFAALALALAAVGLYGVVSYSVTQRTHEMGVRMALGAEKKEVIKLVVAQGFKLTALGIALGITGAFLLTRFLSRLLYGVKTTDPATFVAVSLLLSTVALLASYIPARRAAQVDPMMALRHE